MRLINCAIFLFLTSICFAQDPTPPAGLEGLDLRNWLRTNWYNPYYDELSYSQARIEMYGTIDNQGGTVECIYTGFTQDAAPVSYLDPINAEHTVPQTYFNSQLPMRSDIHHLFPTHGQANGDRGSLPFDEVVDNQADEWIIGTSGNYNSSGNVPSNNIDAYSEVHHNVAFEPREENKGNIARAVMYFYTMYANNVESQYSDISSICDLDVIYGWHVMDPPDAIEIERDEQIQAAQGNYNPYIRMPNLAAPAWGFPLSQSEEELEYAVVYRPSQALITVTAPAENLTLELYNTVGQVLASSVHTAEVSTEGLVSGIYLIRYRDEDGRFGVTKVYID